MVAGYEEIHARAVAARDAPMPGIAFSEIELPARTTAPA
jgi:hypothetical protein